MTLIKSISGIRGTIGGYADVASYQNFLYVLYEVTEQGDISRMMLRKIAL